MYQKYLIYTLIDPNTQEVRYVGRSSNALNRPKWHLAKSTLNKSNLKVHNWIKQLVTQQKQPIISIVEQWAKIDNESLNAAEIKWISFYKEQGARLTNMTDGGDGVLGRELSETHRLKIIESNKKRKYSKETLSKMSDSAKVRTKQKPKKKLKFSDGRTFLGYAAAAQALGCSLSRVYEVVNKQQCYNKVTIEIET